MANRTPQQITRAGVVPVYNAGASGDTVTPGDQVFLHVKCTTATTTLTITATASKGGLVVTAPVISIAVGESIIGPITPELFANATDGEAHLAWSTAANITWAALTL